jgi:hypothetical protein
MLHNRTRAAITAGAVLVSIGAAAGCSSSGPTAPGPATNRMDLLSPGSYVLLVSTTPDQSAACRADPPRSPLLLGLVAIGALTVTHDGQTWVARATNSADGDIELRLRHVRDEAVIGGQVMIATIEGTIRGAIRVPGATISDGVSFGTTTATRMDGSIARQGSGLGTITGEITQSNSVGSFSCPTARWTLSRGQFPGF